VSGINLYPDQAELITKVKTSMRRTRRTLIHAETGYGKTQVGSFMIAGTRAKDATSIFMVPRRELLKQTAISFNKNDLPFSYISSGYDFNPFSKTYLATTGTLIRRLDKIPIPKVLFIDEAHYAGKQNKEIADYFHDRGAWIIGLTATPQYPNGRGMGDCYNEMVSGNPMSWLIANKRLSDYKAYAPSKPDLSKIKTVDGDYAKGQLEELMEQDGVLIGDAVRHYREMAMGRLAIAYCTSIKHSQLTAEAFVRQGIPAAHVDGKTPDDEMKRILRAFARREILVLTCCDLLLFGFDLSAASGMDVTIEVMIDLRPTKSLTLQRQKTGRVLRYKDYPALIFDHAGNIAEHGLPDDEHEWSLEGVDKGGGGGSSSVKHCPKCHYAHSPRPVCPDCGHVYPVQSREIEEIEGELLEISRDALRKNQRMQQGMAESLEELVELGMREKGMDMWKATRWASHIITAREAKRRAR